MKTAPGILALSIAAGMIAVAPGSSASTEDAPGVSTQFVITVLSPKGGSLPERLTARDLSIRQGKTTARITALDRLSGDDGALQLFILLDDSSQTSLSLHFGELRTFLEALPATTQVAIGYMQNGRASLTQSFTIDHHEAAQSLRVPLSVPGLNGSPYFALSDLIKHWPSQAPTKESASDPAPRRAILMLTDGVDRYYGLSEVDDPYADAAVRRAQTQGVTVYSIYLRDTGAYDRSGLVTNYAQSRLEQVAGQTGGYAYFLDFSNPVTIAPFLFDLINRLDNQYRVSLAGITGKGLQEVKVRTALPSLKISAPSRVYLP